MASDYKEVRNVFMYSVPQATLISRDKPVRAMADLKGMKILTPGAAFAPIIGAWGASPVPMDLNDMFNALSTGVVDCHRAHADRAAAAVATVARSPNTSPSACRACSIRAAPS